MNANYLNLVSTRACDGDHAALQRWYSDHIGILWGCETLVRATLYRREAAEGNEADCICWYSFPDEAGFLAYEHGDAREAARLVIVNGWGREGVAITERRQFRREWTQRRGGAGALNTVWCLRLGAGAWGGVSRWLVEQVHHHFGSGAVTAATLLRATDASDAGGDVLLSLQSNEPLPAALDWRDDAWGERPASVELRWRWSGREVMDWQR